MCKQTRDFIHVHDVAKTIFSMIEETSSFDGQYSLVTSLYLFESVEWCIHLVQIMHRAYVLDPMQK